MTAQVEAKSLSALNLLAANPPQYPVNPAQDKHESLILYISRVPGTRDVILSTFKPHLKNVTVDDIANSLYYIHLDLPSDQHLAAPAPLRDPASPRTSGERSRSKEPIQRKPLPASAKVAPLESHASATAPVPTVPTEEHSKVVAQDVWLPPGYRLEESPTFDSVPSRPALPPRPQEVETSPQGQAAIQRKPLGLRPIESHRNTEKDSTPLGVENVDRRVPNAPIHQTPPRPMPAYNETLPDPPRPVQDPMSLPSPHRNAPPRFVPFHLTIIRRDPSSGHQWNIGQVSSYQADVGPSDGTNHEAVPAPVSSSNGQPAINIHLETSGYAKFRDFPTTGQNLDSRRAPSPHSMAKAVRSDELLKKMPEEGFSRQLVMSYTKNWTSNIREAFKRHDRSQSSEDAAFGDLEPPKRTPGRHGRQGSAHSFGSVDSRGSGDGREERDSPPPLLTKPGPGLRPKGYVFTSPWDGLCEFRTGNGGRSLKCRHVMSSNSAAFNPLMLAQGIRDGQGLGRGRQGSISAVITGATPVSELRFNLPSGELFKSSKGSKDLQSKFDKFLKLEPRRGSFSDDDDDLPMDLSLGKERAGGGNRGKRAKLGKLIIHDEGLKMLDLVVASNVGIWWGAYERNF